MLFHDDDGGSPVIFLSLTVFLSFIPGGPGLVGSRISLFWILLERRMMEMVVTTGAVRHAVLQSDHKCDVVDRPYHISGHV